MFEELFLRKKPVENKLSEFGFLRENSVWRYSVNVLDNTFCLYVTVTDSGIVDTDLIEAENGEPYVLYKTDAAGSFVGAVREAVETILKTVAEQCFETAVFKTEQAQLLIRYAREKYGNELEFLWTKFPDNAVWRRKDNQKWYGAILTVEGNKIGLETPNIVEIIDLRMNPADKDFILSQEHYYPGWHMNKNSWYTVVLDGSVSDDEIKQRLDESYALAK